MKFLSNAVWNVIQAELEAKREDVRRLTEALARKNDVPLYMPQSQILQQNVPVVEKSLGWFDQKPISLPTLGEKRQ